MAACGILVAVHGLLLVLQSNLIQNGEEHETIFRGKELHFEFEVVKGLGGSAAK